VGLSEEVRGQIQEAYQSAKARGTYGCQGKLTFGHCYLRSCVCAVCAVCVWVWFSTCFLCQGVLLDHVTARNIYWKLLSMVTGKQMSTCVPYCHWRLPHALEVLPVFNWQSFLNHRLLRHGKCGWVLGWRLPGVVWCYHSHRWAPTKNSRTGGMVVNVRILQPFKGRRITAQAVKSNLTHPFLSCTNKSHIGYIRIMRVHANTHAHIHTRNHAHTHASNARCG